VLNERIRDCQPSDCDPVVALSLRARAVREVLADEATRAWVAEDDAGVAGFVAATFFDPERKLGEIVMLAVDPGQAPARRVYEKADYTLIPMARYFKAL
jgi:N-acetylglutamate synthase-like GNAT family acetyltransferase